MEVPINNKVIFWLENIINYRKKPQIILNMKNQT